MSSYIFTWVIIPYSPSSSRRIEIKSQHWNCFKRELRVTYFLTWRHVTLLVMLDLDHAAYKSSVNPVRPVSLGTWKAAFLHLHYICHFANICTIGQYSPLSMPSSNSRLEYCIEKVQRIKNASTRLATGLPRLCQIFFLNSTGYPSGPGFIAKDFFSPSSMVSLLATYLNS